jgi:hypothetical protein
LRQRIFLPHRWALRCTGFFKVCRALYLALQGKICGKLRHPFFSSLFVIERARSHRSAERVSRSHARR